VRTAVVLLLLAGVASADPLFGPPPIGRAAWGDPEKDPWVTGLVLEARALGVAGVERLSAWSDRLRGIEQSSPELVAGRVGFVAHASDWPISFVARADLAEPTTPVFGDLEPGAMVGAIADDLYLLWRPWRPLSLVVGRARVPVSKMRQFEEAELPDMAVPFLVDRTIPDRRTGVTAFGDFGALSWAAGAYEDVDALEPRAPGDPSSDGAALATFHTEWTPVAPMMGSNPVGRIPGARGPAPTPRVDPWFGTLRFSLGLGAVGRFREDGSQRIDGTISVQLKWRWLAVIGETIISNDRGAGELGAWTELMVTPFDRFLMTGRAEWDGGAGAEGVWTAGGGFSWYATKDRRSRLGFFGWFRQDLEHGTPLHGAVVLIQASL
jgi:hypothetical protein